MVNNIFRHWHLNYIKLGEVFVTFGADATMAIRPVRSNVGQTQRAHIEILVCKEMSQTHVRCLLRYIGTELLHGDQAYVNFQ